MSAKLHGQRLQARVTPQHNSKVALDQAIPEGRRNTVPNLAAKAVRWYICTTAPSRELSAAASIRQIELCGPRAGEKPFLAYVPCEFFWRRAIRSNLLVPRRELQYPILRHYLFVGVLGGLCDETLSVLRERDVEGRNVHGLIGILGSPTTGPLPLNGIGKSWLRKQGEDEIAGLTNRTPAGVLQAGEDVRAGSGVFSGFVGKFVASTDGGAVGVMSIEVMGAACDVRLPIEDVHRAA